MKDFTDFAPEQLAMIFLDYRRGIITLTEEELEHLLQELIDRPLDGFASYRLMEAIHGGEGEAWTR